MKKTGKKLIIFSFLLALISTMIVYQYLQSFNKSSKNSGKKITVLVAKETISSRTIIEKKMIKEIKVSDNSIFKDYIKDYSKIVGKYTKDTIIKNQGFYSENLLSKNGTEISAKVDNNHRAVSINVTGDSGVSYLLNAGDYVDIIAYFPEKKEAEGIVRPETAKIILEKVEVLAIDNKISKDKNTKSEDQKIPATFLVTLSIPFEDIEKLVLAEDIGSLKLALRPLNKEDDVESKGAKWQDILTSTPVKNENVKSEDKSVSYTVKKGDTLRTISLQFYGDSEKFYIIKEANNIENENLIVPDEVIKIP